MLTALIIVGWVVCGILAYLLFRWHIRNVGGSWTTDARFFGLIISLMGLLGLLAGFFTIVMEKMDKPDNPDKPAKW